MDIHDKCDSKPWEIMHIDDIRGRKACEVIQSEAGALGLDPRAIHVDIGRGWGFRRARSQSPNVDEQSRQQSHEALLAFGCPIPLGESMRRRAESMPPVGMNRTKSELLAGLPLSGAGADIELAGGKKLEGLPEYPRGEQLSHREACQRLCGVSIDHQPRRRSPPPASLIPTRGWETLSPRQQNEHTLKAEKYAALLGRDTLRRERVEDVATPRMVKDHMSSNSTASSITTRSPRVGWNKYFHLGKSSLLNHSAETPRLENDVARWYRANRRTICAEFDLCTTSLARKESFRLVDEHLTTTAMSTCFVAPPTDSIECSPVDSIECSPVKGGVEEGEATPAATTAGPSTAGSSPPSSTPPVPVSPPVPDSELIVMGNITIPARLQSGYPCQSPKKCSAPTVLSPRKHPALQKAKVAAIRSQPKEKPRRSPPTSSEGNAPSIAASKSSRTDTRAALARVKDLKAQMMSHNYDLASVQRELDVVERLLH